ncbi:MAG: oxidoreductase [Eggerthellaceae bacterium]|nr:oxidoreductase [Eggerthellaceae bacterium]
MPKLGFYFDAESCIACHTCQVACKDTHHLPVGTNYRVVRSFCTGSDWEPRLYNVSLATTGCTLCADLREVGEQPACVASCPMRALEFGDVDELAARHAGEPLADGCAAVPNAAMANRNFIMRVKDCMADPDFDEIII